MLNAQSESADAPAATDQRGEGVVAADRAAPSSSPKILIKDVEKQFYSRRHTVHALGPANLEVEEGSFVCLVGPSGCGKSTILRMLAGLVTPTSGSVELRPRSADGPTAAMVFQEYAIYPWKTVLANVRVGLDLGGVGRQEADRRAHTWLERLGLTAFADAYPSKLSGGMRQRVSIARALAVEPEILLMDEPFAALDAQLRAILQEELLALWEASRRTVVFVTHSIEEAILLGDRVAVMSARPGRLIADFTVPFARPRTPDVRADPRFGALQQQIWDLLRDEVDRSLADQKGKQ